MAFLSRFQQAFPIKKCTKTQTFGWRLILYQKSLGMKAHLRLGGHANLEEQRKNGSGGGLREKRRITLEVSRVNEAKRNERRLDRLVMRLHCCACGGEVEARLTNGGEIYPHRSDLFSLPFWKCDNCGNFVGCHHKTKDRTRPLGCIPTQEIKNARKHIHALIDPIWESGKMTRKSLYCELAVTLGREYHTADIRTIDEARAIYRKARELAHNTN